MHKQVDPVATSENHVTNFRLGMRRLASGVSVITSRLRDRNVGLLATSVTSVCIDPPTLLVSVNQQSTSYEVIRESGAFCVNVLAADQEAIAGQFADPNRRGERFRTGEWTETSSGCLALEGTMAVFDCAIVKSVVYCSSTIFFGLVTDSRVSRGENRPLVHYDRQFYLLRSGIG